MVIPYPGGLAGQRLSRGVLPPTRGTVRRQHGVRPVWEVGIRMPSARGLGRAQVQLYRVAVGVTTTSTSSAFACANYDGAISGDGNAYPPDGRIPEYESGRSLAVIRRGLPGADLLQQQSVFRNAGRASSRRIRCPVVGLQPLRGGVAGLDPDQSLALPHLANALRRHANPPAHVSLSASLGEVGQRPSIESTGAVGTTIRRPSLICGRAPLLTAS